MTRTDGDFFRGGDDPNRNEQLKNFLRDLKTSGGSILVTGKISNSIAQKQMQKAFGADDRKRILGLSSTVPEESPTDCLPDGTTPTDPGVRVVVDRRDSLRSATSVPDDAPSPTNHYLELMQYRHAIEDEISGLDDRFDLVPGDLRVVINSLDGLLDDTDRTTVRGFVRGISRFVRDADGITYFHLRHPDSSDIAQFFGEIVDARIELRYGTHEELRPEERWHVPHLDLTSDWTRLLR
ncbi:DUF7504 family protein [Halorussus salinus]|uniref:DUF7504 family protein n=1 Tax=Halorussus salinus TaxID=1364935 RepID=UPI0010932AF3|nr:hypothetical protein [Halorussus salinus]